MSIEERRKFRRDAALAFTIAACDNKGMASDNDIRYAVEQADRLITQLEADTIKVDEGTPYG